MNLLKLSWSYLKAKPLSSVLNVLLVALGVGLTSILLLINHQANERLYRNIENIHLVVGAKGSPLQMILSYVYHIDIPTGNIPLSESAIVTKNPFVEKAIPLALGDSYKDFRIVGTTTEYVDLYQGRIAKGKLWKNDLEVVLGARVAKKLKLGIGAEFHGSHGLVADESMHAHDEHSYRVVGILESTGTVLDQVILTNVSSVWRMHEGHDHEDAVTIEVIDSNTTDSAHAGHNHDAHAEHSHDEHNHDAHAHDEHDHSHDGHNHDGHDHAAHNHNATNLDSLAPISPEGKEITAYLVQYKRDKEGNVSAMATNMVPRLIDDNSEKLGYAMPAIQLQRLLDMTGVGVQFLGMLAWLIIGISGFSVFISLYNSLKERRYEIALMRVMGASGLRIFTLIVLEGILLAILGILVGLLLSHAGMAMLASQLEAAYQYEFSGAIFLPAELWLSLGVVGIGFLAALLPAVQAYQTNISTTLGQS